MKKLNNLSASKRNYYVDIIAFLPFLLLLITGVVMLAYHNGTSNNVEIISLNGFQWINIHKVLTVIATPLVIIHLVLHADWVKKLFTMNLKKRKYKGLNIALFITFLLCMFTALFSWLVFGSSSAGEALRGIHNKFGLLLIALFVFHIINYSKWIIGMTKKALNKT